VLNFDKTDAQLLDEAAYQSSTAADQFGRTVIIPDKYGGDDKAHWFIIRSDLGDHPMYVSWAVLASVAYLFCSYLHGHHFQILAKLPSG
jgi:hypothetical protein